MVEATKSQLLDDVINDFIENVLKLFSNVENFILLGHSLGAVLSLKIAKKLEDCGKRGQIILIDGSPEFCAKFATHSYKDESLKNFEYYIAKIVYDILKPYNDFKIPPPDINNFDNWMKMTREIITSASIENELLALHFKYIVDITTSYKNRLNITLNLKSEEFDVLETTNVSLIKASVTTVSEISDDYGLSAFSSQNVSVKSLSGDHLTVLQNPELFEIIKNFKSI
jgi:fatty acid synthase